MLQVKEGVKALGMCMGEQCPEVLFELERQACAQSVADRDPMAAVLHCRACLTPLASQHPSFLPALKVQSDAVSCAMPCTQFVSQLEC